MSNNRYCSIFFNLAGSFCHALVRLSIILISGCFYYFLEFFTREDSPALRLRSIFIIAIWRISSCSSGVSWLSRCCQSSINASSQISGSMPALRNMVIGEIFKALAMEIKDFSPVPLAPLMILLKVPRDIPAAFTRSLCDQFRLPNSFISHSPKFSMESILPYKMFSWECILFSLLTDFVKCL